MTERQLRIRLGGFVALAMAALTALIMTFGGMPKLFTKQTTYTVYFPEAPGVGPGTPVRKSGVRIGKVNSLELDNDTGRVKLIIEIEGVYLPRVNEEPAITRGLLSGDTSVDFIPKTDKDGMLLARAEPYPPGAEIVGIPPLNTTRLINQAQQTVPTAQEALSTFTNTVGSFQNVGPKVETAVDEIRQFVQNANELLPELRETNRRVQDFIGAPDEPRPMPRDPRNEVSIRTNGRLAQEQPESPANLKALTREIQDFVKAWKPLADDLRKLVKDNEAQITQTLKSLETLSTNAAAVLSDQNRAALVRIISNFEEATSDLLSQENRAAVKAILTNLNGTSTELAKALKNSEAIVKKVDTALDNINKAVVSGGDLFTDARSAVNNINGRVDQIKAILESAEKLMKPLGEQVGPTIQNISKAADELAKTIAESRQVIALLTRDNGTLGKFVNDPQLYNQLADAASNLNRTLIRAEKIAKDLEVFADKVARKPETIGIGGALRPSTGLKESPYAPLPGSTPYPPLGPPPAFDEGGQLKPIPPVGSGIGGLPSSSWKITDNPVTPQTNIPMLNPVGPRRAAPPQYTVPKLGEPR
jgi:ABC-type transporter Mla subunit MlaD